MEVMNRESVPEFLDTLDVREFEVVFIKRTTGEPRVLRGTKRYAKHLKGGEPAYNFAEKKLIPIWDLDKQAFRSIPLDAVLTIKVKRQVYTVV